jgi:molybdopterin converting factor small subunit
MGIERRYRRQQERKTKKELTIAQSQMLQELKRMTPEQVEKKREELKNGYEQYINELNEYRYKLDQEAITMLEASDGQQD